MNDQHNPTPENSDSQDNQPTATNTETPTRRWRQIAIGLTAAVAITTIISACGHRSHSWHHDETVSSEKVTKMVDKIFSRVDASDEQKASISKIANKVVAEISPMRSEMRSTRGEALKLLSAAQIDRAAIETLRVDRMASATRASEIISVAMADIAEVLTPEQRQQASDKISKRMKH